jgi:hypothetical protein
MNRNAHRVLNTTLAVVTALLAAVSSGSAATATFMVSDGNDDGFAAWSTGQAWTSDFIRCGYNTNYAAPYEIGAFRFANVTIPQGATISNAYLRVQAYLGGTGSSSFSIVGEDYDLTSSYEYLPYIGQRTVTSSQVSWLVSTPWTEDDVYTSPDIAGIVQEIVDRTGWSSGNPMAIQLRNTASSGGYQLIYSFESAPIWEATAAQLIVMYDGDAPPDGVKQENYIPGATNTTSSVPLYLNNPSMYYPAASGGLCWASANADILAYWDRNPHAGTQYWNLVDNGTAPLRQPALPTAPGHDMANVYDTINWLAHQYYGLGRSDEDGILEEYANDTNGLAFNATYHGPVSSTADRTTFLGIIKNEIDAGRPISIGSWGTYFGGAHQVPVIGYKEMSNTVNSTVYIHRNTGGTQSEYVNFFSSSWGNLDMDQIVPGGTPIDHYEARGDNSAATVVSLDPDAVYDFRQTHNFSSPGDEDWVQLDCTSGKRYTIETVALGTNCDTVATLYKPDGTTVIWQDDNGGIQAGESAIAWNCWSNGTYLVKLTEAGGASGHDANYNLEIAYGPATNHAPTDCSLAASSVDENEPAGTVVGTLTFEDPDTGDTAAYALVSGAGSTDNTSFSVSSNELRTVAPLDYESKASCSVRIRATDQSGLWYEESFTIGVNDVNAAPTDLSLSTNAVQENLPAGTTVAVISSTDPEPPAAAYTYTLVSGTGDAGNDVFAIAGSELKTGACLNYEQTNSYSIRIRTTDQGGLWYEEPFAIGIIDIDECPSIAGVELSDGTNVVVRWSSMTNNQYTVRVSTNLMHGFSTVCSNIAAEPPENTFTHTFDNGQGFWQIILED